jgi:3-methyladenine DNA glycosylase/8-oxoguanine DNA glycosylase
VNTVRTHPRHLYAKVGVHSRHQAVDRARALGLQREDVVLPGDLALRKAIQAAYQLDHRPTQEEVLAIAEKWRPCRSLATSYLFSAAFESAEAPPVARPGNG